MKKTIAALAASAAACAASAHSSITLFGVVDASVSQYRVSRGSGVDALAPAKTQTVLANGANTSSRLGFRGTEDLGGGMAGGFWLEAPLGNDNGSAPPRAFDFSRRSTVSLSGPFGEIRLGRDNTPTDWNDVVFSPLGIQGVGATLILQAAGQNLTPHSSLPGDGNAVRASNSVSYFLPPNLGGFYGQLMYALHENAKSDTVLPGGSVVSLGSTKGRYVGGRFGFAKGSLDVVAAYGESTLGNFAGTLVSPYGFTQFAAAYDAEVRTISLGASYDFGFLRLLAQLSQVETTFDQPAMRNPQTGALRTAVSDATRNDAWALGGVVPIGPGEIKFSYSRLKIRWPDSAGVTTPDPSTSKVALGYVHNLSKRTALYATAARLSNSNGASFAIGGVGNSQTPITGNRNADSTGYDVGMRHVF